MPSPRDLAILFDFPNDLATGVSRVNTSAGAVPQGVLSASDMARLDEFSNKYGANMNSSKAPGNLTIDDQTTLLRYLHSEAGHKGDRVMPRSHVSGGAPRT